MIFLRTLLGVAIWVFAVGAPLALGARPDCLSARLRGIIQIWVKDSRSAPEAMYSALRSKKRLLTEEGRALLALMDEDHVPELRKAQAFTACLSSNCKSERESYERLRMVARDRDELAVFSEDPEAYRLSIQIKGIADVPATPIRAPDISLRDSQEPVISPRDVSVFERANGTRALRIPVQPIDFHARLSILSSPSGEDWIIQPKPRILGALENSYSELERLLAQNGLQVQAPKKEGTSFVSPKFQNLAEISKTSGALSREQSRALGQLMGQLAQLDFYPQPELFVWVEHKWRADLLKLPFMSVEYSPNRWESLIKEQLSTGDIGPTAEETISKHSSHKKMGWSAPPRATTALDRALFWLADNNFRAKAMFDGFSVLARGEQDPILSGFQINDWLYKAVKVKTKNGRSFDGFVDGISVIVNDRIRGEHRYEWRMTLESGEQVLIPGSEVDHKASHVVPTAENPSPLVLELIDQVGAENLLSISYSSPKKPGSSSIKAKLSHFAVDLHGHAGFWIESFPKKKRQFLSADQIKRYKIISSVPGPSLSAMAKAKGFTHLSHQCWPDNSIQILKEGVLFPRATPGAPGVYLTLESGSPTSPRKHMVSNYQPVRLIFDASILDKLNYHLTNDWAFGDEYPFDKNPMEKKSIRPGRPAEFAEILDHIKADEASKDAYRLANEVVFHAPMSTRSVTAIVVQPNYRDKFIAQLKKEGILPPPGRTYDDWVLNREPEPSSY